MLDLNGVGFTDHGLADGGLNAALLLALSVLMSLLTGLAKALQTSTNNLGTALLIAPLTFVDSVATLRGCYQAHGVDGPVAKKDFSIGQQQAGAVMLGTIAKDRPVSQVQPAQYSAGPIDQVAKPAYRNCYCLMSYADWLAWSIAEEAPLSWDKRSDSIFVCCRLWKEVL